MRLVFSKKDLSSIWAQMSTVVPDFTFSKISGAILNLFGKGNKAGRPDSSEW
jgi:hypothetical protein